MRAADGLGALQSLGLALLLLLQVQPSAALTLDVEALPTDSLGAHVEVLSETAQKLDLSQAMQHYQQGDFSPGERDTLTYGIGARPKWVHLGLDNHTGIDQIRSLQVGTTWMDELDVFQIVQGKTQSTWHTGDEHPHAVGRMPGMGYVQAFHFPPGHTDLFLRIDSVDPMVIPIRLLAADELANTERYVHYRYGLIYGFLLALFAYNAMLYAGMRKRSYLYYSFYLASLVFLNIAYTGHGGAWLWPDHPDFQRYVILVAMVVYSSAGLRFASRFLTLEDDSPRIYRAIRHMMYAGLALMLGSIALGSQYTAALVAFSYTALAALVMVLLGTLTAKRGRPAGRYYLAAAIFGVAGALLTTFSVWGLTPFNAFTYHGVEYGVVIEATLFATALSYRFREMMNKMLDLLVSREELVREMNDKRQAEERLRKSEESLRESQFIANLGSLEMRADDGSWKSSLVLDMLLGVDERYERTFRSWLALIAPQDREMMTGYIEQDVFGRGLAFEKEFRIRRLSDGQERWLHALGRVERDLQGQPVQLRATLQDITERKNSEIELRVAATAFESQEGMLITDANNTILRVNGAFTNITGYTADEVVGCKPNLLSSGKHDAQFYRDMWAQINQHGSWEGEVWNRRKNGVIYPEYLIISVVKDEHGTVTNYVATFSDTTATKAAAEEIKHLAFYDALTQLPNRRLLLDRLSHALATSARSEQYGAVLFIDLDNFKTLNDTLGHDMGDMLLREVSARLLQCVRAEDTVARLGGDEFVILLENLSKAPMDAADQAEAISEKILLALNENYQLGTHDYHCTPSIGATLFVKQASMDDLFKQADIAMYQAKKAGRNTIRFFDPEMQASINERARLTTELRLATISDDQFQLYFQPQVDGSGELTGAEALVRWRHPARGIVSPSDFIPLAEESALILPIGHWVLRSACQQLASWAKQESTRHLTLSANISAKQFRLNTFVDEVIALIEVYQIDAGKLKLEVTESMLLEDLDTVIGKMERLRAMGIRFCMDDFGTGYSSLQYLKLLPIDQIKIDQSFVRDLAHDSNDQAIVRTIIGMAKNLNLDILAEGVESEEQRQYLLVEGCSNFQGYLFGMPQPIEAFEALLLGKPKAAPTTDRTDYSI